MSQNYFFLVINIMLQMLLIKLVLKPDRSFKHILITKHSTTNKTTRNQINQQPAEQLLIIMLILQWTSGMKQIHGHVVQSLCTSNQVYDESHYQC